jgi:hypothetical protein
MSKNEKAVAKMRENQTGWRIEDLQAIARRYGIDWRHDSGSHCVFITQSGKTLPVPAKKPIKPIYIKKFLTLLEE